MDQLADIGINMVIWPVSLLRLGMGSAVRGLDALIGQGTLEPVLGEMRHRADLYELLDYESYNRFDTNGFNFQIKR